MLSRLGITKPQLIFPGKAFLPLLVFQRHPGKRLSDWYR
jgi:hypothetical protein